jgi:hypothetical protein
MKYPYVLKRVALIRTTNRVFTYNQYDSSHTPSFSPGGWTGSSSSIEFDDGRYLWPFFFILQFLGRLTDNYESLVATHRAITEYLFHFYYHGQRSCWFKHWSTPLGTVWRGRVDRSYYLRSSIYLQGSMLILP